MLEETRRKRRRQTHPQIVLTPRQPTQRLNKVLELRLASRLHRERLLRTLHDAYKIVVLRRRDVVHTLMDALYVHLHALLYNRTEDW